MRITLVSHASILIRTRDAVILTDPWYLGKAFNDSWTLYPPAAYDESMLDQVDFLWISHEHPDHFHIPTLRALPSRFKERVRLLFQRNNSDKMFEAFRRFGFKSLQALPHRQIVGITPGTEVYCHQVGPMDSMLGVRCDGETLLNVNDCEANDAICRTALKDLARVDLVTNQFSFAGYPGNVNYREVVPAMARARVQDMLSNHVALKARVSIPFASFIYFSCSDNQHLNQFANTPRILFDAFRAEGHELAALYPGDTFDSTVPYDSAPSLARFDADYQRLPQQPIDAVAPVPADKLKEAFGKFVTQLRDKYPRWVLNRLQPVTVDVPDLGIGVRFSLASGALEAGPPDPAADLIINSQPLFFAFSHSFGVQTLGVSGRFFVQNNSANWRRHRILTSLFNAEIYLRPRYLFSRRNLAFFRERLPGAFTQLRNQLRRMG